MSMTDRARAAFWTALAEHCRLIGFRAPSLGALPEIRCKVHADRFACDADGHNGLTAAGMVKFDPANERAAVVSFSRITRTMISKDEVPGQLYPVRDAEAALRELMFQLSRPRRELRQEPALRQEVSPQMQLQMRLAMGLFAALEREQMLQSAVPNRRTHQEISRNIGCYRTPCRKGCP